jgi:hypothetical protein
MHRGMEHGLILAVSREFPHEFFNEIIELNSQVLAPEDHPKP